MNQTTKKSFIAEHPKSHLAQALRGNAWPARATIVVASGIVPATSHASNLFAAIMAAGADPLSAEVAIGGRADKHATAGYHFAVLAPDPRDVDCRRIEKIRRAL